mmetsp:Transcript_6957/g.20409  ORF Transcript_6957/g.20409 Transcript_6957/m.20409 type:complete len:268 (-) Transcript_6957:743-1546(-)
MYARSHANIRRGFLQHSRQHAGELDVVFHAQMGDGDAERQGLCESQFGRVHSEELVELLDCAAWEEQDGAHATALDNLVALYATHHGVPRRSRVLHSACIGPNMGAYRKSDRSADVIGVRWKVMEVPVLQRFDGILIQIRPNDGPPETVGTEQLQLLLEMRHETLCCQFRFVVVRSEEQRVDGFAVLWREECRLVVGRVVRRLLHQPLHLLQRLLDLRRAEFGRLTHSVNVFVHRLALVQRQVVHLPRQDGVRRNVGCQLIILRRRC